MLFQAPGLLPEILRLLSRRRRLFPKFFPKVFSFRFLLELSLPSRLFCFFRLFWKSFFPEISFLEILFLEVLSLEVLSLGILFLAAVFLRAFRFPVVTDPEHLIQILKFRPITVFQGDLPHLVCTGILLYHGFLQGNPLDAMS